MKKLFKTSLTSLIIVLASTLTMSVYAYSGTMDTDDNIKIINNISNGAGLVDINGVSGYQLFYQWVEIDSNTYNQIQKINDEALVIKYYNLYEGYTINRVTDLAKEYGQKYANAQKAYEAKYGVRVSDFSTQHSAELKALKIHAFPNYDDSKWVQTIDNTFKMDLSTFTGTKDYTAWIKLVSTDGKIVAYDAEAFELTGTKQASTDNPGTDKPGTDKPGTDNPGTDNPGTDKPGTDNPGTDKPGTDNPGTDKPGTDNPGTDKPGTDKPGTDNPGTDKPSTDEPGTDKPSTDKPSTDKPSTNKPSTNNNNTNVDKDDGKDEPISNSKNDGTTSNTKLPQTGVSYGIVIATIAAAGVATIEFVKYKRIK